MIEHDTEDRPHSAVLVQDANEAAAPKSKAQTRWGGGGVEGPEGKSVNSAREEILG